MVKIMETPITVKFMIWGVKTPIFGNTHINIVIICFSARFLVVKVAPILGPFKKPGQMRNDVKISAFQHFSNYNYWDVVSS